MKFPLAILLLLASASCNNMTSDEERFSQRFDSIRHVLQQTQQMVNNETDSIYAQMIEKAGNDKGGIRQFYYHIHDFYGYVGNLRWQLYKASGDSAGTGLATGREDDISLTKNFFQSGNDAPRLLYTSLRFTFEKLRHQASDDEIRFAITRFEDATLGTMSSMNDFYEVYLKNATPATVITILNNFEQKIRGFELQILNAHFNNYINELKEKILWDGNSDRDTLQQ